MAIVSARVFMSICGVTNVASKGLITLLLLGSAAYPQMYVGSKVCAECHQKIAESYSQTAMAQASGHIADLHLPDGEVLAAKGKVTYGVTWKDGGAQLSYKKDDVAGSKALRYYIGSGTHGRGFIFEEKGQPFQSPIAYYGPTRGWDVAPGYEGETGIFIARKVEKSCLSCHTSGVKPVAAGLFEEGAISCERCHGPGDAHVKAVRSGKATAATLAIVNPAKLDAARRDSVCARCHLTGETRILKPGRTETSFQPGDILTDSIVPFVWATPDQAQFKVVGHFEGLWRSKCKRVSGDRLSCLTCHDPHMNVPEPQRASYYRAKCLGCHAQTDCQATAAVRKAKDDSCIACHMQQRASTDGQHTAFTDHSIRRVPAANEVNGHSEELVAFWKDRATPRDYALAYTDIGDWRTAREELLKVADDPTVASALAYTDDLAGEAEKAEALYRQALAADQDDLLALTNLGIHLARKGNLKQAADLWKHALAINPGLEAPGLNLARVEWQLGQHADAKQVVLQVLSLNPDSAQAQSLLREMKPIPSLVDGIR